MATNEDFVIGRHPAVAALKSKQAVNKVFLQAGLRSEEHTSELQSQR